MICGEFLFKGRVEIIIASSIRKTIRFIQIIIRKIMIIPLVDIRLNFAMNALLSWFFLLI